LPLPLFSPPPPHPTPPPPPHSDRNCTLFFFFCGGPYEIPTFLLSVTLEGAKLFGPPISFFSSVYPRKAAMVFFSLLSPALMILDTRRSVGRMAGFSFSHCLYGNMISFLFYFSLFTPPFSRRVTLSPFPLLPRIFIEVVNRECLQHLSSFLGAPSRFFPEFRFVYTFLVLSPKPADRSPLKDFLPDHRMAPAAPPSSYLFNLMTSVEIVRADLSLPFFHKTLAAVGSLFSLRGRVLLSFCFMRGSVSVFS